MEVRCMKKKWVVLNEAEWRLILHAMNELRNSLIAEGRYTDVVDEVILIIINAPVKKKSPLDNILHSIEPLVKTSGFFASRGFTRPLHKRIVQKNRKLAKRRQNRRWQRK